MAEFFSSKLAFILGGNGMLSQDAWDFACACMDDFYVDEIQDGAETFYELRGTLIGWYKGKAVEVTQVYCADLCGMAALIEHLALTNANSTASLNERGEVDNIVAMVKEVKDEMNDYDLEDDDSREWFLNKPFRFGFGDSMVTIENDADVWEIMNRALDDVLKLVKGENKE